MKIFSGLHIVVVVVMIMGLFGGLAVEAKHFGYHNQQLLKISRDHARDETRWVGT